MFKTDEFSPKVEKLTGQWPIEERSGILFLILFQKNYEFLTPNFWRSNIVFTNSGRWWELTLSAVQNCLLFPEIRKIGQAMIPQSQPVPNKKWPPPWTLPYKASSGGGHLSPKIGFFSWFGLHFGSFLCGYFSKSKSEDSSVLPRRFYTLLSPGWAKISKNWPNGDQVKRAHGFGKISQIFGKFSGFQDFQFSDFRENPFFSLQWMGGPHGSGHIFQ